MSFFTTHRLRAFILSGILSSGFLESLPAQQAAEGWKNVVIGGGGYCTGITFAPSQPGLLIARSDVAGPWIRASTDEPWRAATWTNVFPTPLQASCGAAIHPTNPQIMFCELGNGGTTSGLYQSLDGGVTWRLALQKYSHANQGGSSGDPVINQSLADERLARRWGSPIAIDPVNPGVVYWGTMKDGIWRSLTGGASGTWTQLRAPEIGELSPGTRSIVLDSQSVISGRSAGVYASVNGKGVFQSVDGGDTFALLAGSSAKPAWMRIAADGVVYVAHTTGIARYDGSWTDITPADRAGESFTAIALDPANPARIAAFTRQGSTGSSGATNFFYRSNDRGTSWENIPRSRLTITGTVPIPHFQAPFQSAATLDLDPHQPGSAYMCDAYMIWQTDDLWATGDIVWKAQYQGLEDVIGMALCTPPVSLTGNAPPLLSGVSDVAGFRHADVTAAPVHVLPPSPSDSRYGYTYYHYYNTGMDYCETNPDVIWLNAEDYAKKCSVFRSTDGGLTWGSPLKPNGDAEAPASRIAASATDPLRAVWVPGKGQLPRYTTDGGESWQNCKQASNGANLPAFSPWADAYSNDLHVAADRVDGLTFYAYAQLNVAGSGSPLWITRDGGSTWSRSETILPNRGSVNAYSTPVVVAAAPGRAGDVWVSLGTNGVYRSEDFGVTFAKITFFEGSTPQVITFGKEAPGNPVSQPALYVWGIALSDPTNTLALYRSTDLGTNWTRLAVPDGLQYALPAADRQTFGRVYLATGSRAVLYGDPAPVGVPPVGQQIWLRSSYTGVVTEPHGQAMFVGLNTATSPTPMIAGASTVGTTEKLLVIGNDDGTVSLRSVANNGWITARTDLPSAQQSPLQTIDTSTLTDREKFYWAASSGNTISLRCKANNLHVAAVKNVATAPLRARSAAVSNWERFTWSLVPLPPMDQWRVQHWSSTSNTGDAADTADANNDGIANLLAYSRGLSPFENAAGLVTSISPPSNPFALTFTRVKSATDIIYQVWSSENLTDWSEIWTSADHPYPTTAGSSETVTVAEPLPPSGQGKRFMKLQITRP